MPEMMPSKQLIPACVATVTFTLAKAASPRLWQILTFVILTCDIGSGA